MEDKSMGEMLLGEKDLRRSLGFKLLGLKALRFGCTPSWKDRLRSMHRLRFEIRTRRPTCQATGVNAFALVGQVTLMRLSIRQCSLSFFKINTHIDSLEEVRSWVDLQQASAARAPACVSESAESKWTEIAMTGHSEWRARLMVRSTRTVCVYLTQLYRFDVIQTD